MLSTHAESSGEVTHASVHGYATEPRASRRDWLEEENRIHSNSVS